MMRRFRLIGALVVATTFLVACESAVERAEAHYQKSLEWIAEGDTQRAVVELRNVFQLNGRHRDARWTFAQLMEDTGNVQQAYSQLLRLVEQYPEDVEGRLALIRLALDVRSWDEVERHLAVGRDLAPADPIVSSAMVSLDYRAAIQDQDFPRASAAATNAAVLVSAQPQLFSPRRIVIDDLARQQDWTGALTALDAALDLRPKDSQLHAMRIGMLEQLGDEEGIEAHLLKMTDIFPGDEDVHLSLIRWYTSRGENEKAETYLRGRIETEEDSDAAALALISFMAQTRGIESARVEVENLLLREGINQRLFRSVRAGIDFDLGQTERAIAEMEEILVDAVASEETHRIKISLANMLIRTSNSVGARALVEEVLEADPTQVEALKLKANWLIDDDLTGDAIIELRQALDQAPQDAEIRTLLARAYERSGNRELMIEMLALAVEVSGSAPAESIRYASLLVGDGKLDAAETVLIDALRLAPQNLEILAQLGDLYIRDENWDQAQQVIVAFARSDDDDARRIGRELEARLLAAQNRDAELVGLLSGLMEDGQTEAGASIIRLRLSQGDTKGALEYARRLLIEDPDNPSLRFIEALVLASDGQFDAAAQAFRDLLEESPSAESVRLALYNLYRAQGLTDEATAVLREGLSITPEGIGLNWALATELEFAGDVDGAISIYERLYAQNSDSRAFANNLASLISSYRNESSESLQRAYTIARRLRGTTFPPYQDTYGWIAYLLGNHDEALSYLEPAAKAIPDDPLVRYHLGAVYAALNNPDRARAELERAIELVETRGTRFEALADMEEALDALSRPEAAPEN